MDRQDIFSKDYNPDQDSEVRVAVNTLKYKTASGKS